MEVEWTEVEPGHTFLGSDNRTVLFGGAGPRHEVRINYSFEISSEAVTIGEFSSELKASQFRIASEAEWQLAFESGVISGQVGSSEVTADTISGSYWGKVCDGRALVVDNGMMVIREWEDSGPVTKLVSVPTEYSSLKARLIRPTVPEGGWLDESPRLPSNPGRGRLVCEEAILALLIGIIPSFVWAWFNASQEYIESGWLGLVVGGIFFSLFTATLWRPRTPTWRVTDDGLSMR